MTMPTNTPRSIAEALKELRQVAAAVGAAIETRRTRADETRWSAALTRIADELQALATANGAEGLPEAEGWLCRYGEDLRCWNAYRDKQTAEDVARQWRGTHEPLYTADQMHAYALATRPQAASDGEDARVALLAGVLRETAAVAITMLYASHKADTLAEFSTEELSQVVEASAPLLAENAQVEHVYRRAWDAAMTTDAAKGESNG